MSLQIHVLRRRWLVIAACCLATGLASCAADESTAPRSRPVFDGAMPGDSTPRTPCDSTSATVCHATQGWG
jgi:hypothetical protein